MSKEVIYIDVKDDVTSIIDKINKTEQKIVALVPPKQIGVLQSAVNLQLLAHTAKQTKKIMVIITNQEALIRLAAVAKIPVAKSLTSKPSMPEIPALKVDGDDDIIDGAQLSVGELADMSKKASAISSDVAEAASPTNKLSPAKIKVPNYDKFRKKLFIGGVALLMFSGFLIWAVIFAPRAEITILTNTKGVNVAPSVSLVDQADQAKFENNSLYAQTQKSTHKRSVEFMATGEKELKTHATGEMTVLRRSGSSPKLLPAGTIFTSNSGLRFKSVTDVTVPGATYDENNNPTPGRAKVRVQALEVGDKYNIPAQAYSVQTSSSSITATGGAMSGGSQRIIKVVTQQDYDKAKQELLKDSHDSAVKELRNKFDSSMLIINESLITKEGEITATAKVDEEAKDGKAKLEQEVAYQISAVARKSLEEYLGQIALKDNQSDKAKFKAYTAGLDQVVFSDYVSKDGRSSMRISAQVQIGPDIDADSVKDKSAGRSLGDIRAEYTAIDGVKDVEIRFSPFWVKTVPTNKEKISVLIKN